jgi:AAHS family 4-hydroxybenzoate transporter-like MFS transporter
MLVWLPESVRLMALRPGTLERIARTLKSVNPALSFAPDTQFVVTERTDRDFRVFQLFMDGRTVMTLLLWLIFFMNTTVLNFLNNWLPTLVNTIGLPQEQALRVASTLQFGGVIGVISMGMLADRFGFFRVLASAFVVGCAFVVLVGSVGTSVYLLVATIAIAGYCNVGCQITNAAMAATLYPTNIRSTGVNWAHGVARVFSTIGPYLGGVLLMQQWPPQDILYIFAAPLLVACGLILALSAVVKGASAGAEPSGAPAAVAEGS